MAKMIPVVAREKTNAQTVVRYGLLTTTASAMLLPVVPAPKSRMPTAAPNAAALERPSVKGDASGFLRTDCIATPAIARPAPATTAVSACGILMFQRARSNNPVPPGPANIVASTSGRGIVMAPTEMVIRNSTAQRKMPAMMMPAFFPI